MKNLLTPILNVYRFHKLKVALFFLLYLIIGVMIFPFKDLGDVVTSIVSQQTHQMVYLQFDDLNPSIFPFGVEFKDVSVDSPFSNTLKAKAIVARPAITKLLAGKPGGFVSAEGLFKGSADITAGLTKGKTDGPDRISVSGELKNVELAEVTKALRLPMDMSGRLTFETNEISLDAMNAFNFDGDIKATLKDVKIGAMNVNTPSGPLPLPGLQVSSLNLEAEAKAGTVKVSKLVIGKAGDDISGNVKGQIDIKPSSFGPPIGAYDFSIELDVTQRFKDSMGVVWSTLDLMIDQFKRSGAGDATKYSFRISAQGVTSIPKLSPYQ